MNKSPVVPRKGRNLGSVDHDGRPYRVRAVAGTLQFRRRYSRNGDDVHVSLADILVWSGHRDVEIAGARYRVWIQDGEIRFRSAGGTVDYVVPLTAVLELGRRQLFLPTQP